MLLKLIYYKDLWQYSGAHYNMNTKKLMTITPEEGHKNLWRQMILGDMGTDNIPGLSHSAKCDILFKDEEAKKKHRPIPCHSFGVAKAEKILDETDPKDYPKAIFELYIDAYGTEEEDEDFGEQRFYETFDLVFMLREAPSDLKIHFNPIKVTYKNLEF